MGIKENKMAITLKTKFEESGLECYVLYLDEVLHRTDFHNGYVAIPKGHPLYGVHYDDINIKAHEGLTYSENYLRDIIKPKDRLWVLGFDTANSTDTVDTRSQAYVELETRALAKRIANKEYTIGKCYEEKNVDRQSD